MNKLSNCPLKVLVIVKEKERRNMTEGVSGEKGLQCEESEKMKVKVKTNEF